ncbi:MAG TPA: hypothetical protein PKO06_05130, partial [Candidatus Ozemobacteraceae bacterium]|nr:hypothetical protein [Candidatus Ozemobacteraceae bacterium]
MRLRVIVGIVLVCLALNPVFAFDGVAPDHKSFRYQTLVFNNVHQFWVVNELYAQMAQQGEATDKNVVDKYNQACEIYQKQSAELGRVILSTLDDNREIISLVSDIYKSFDTNSRVALYPALNVVFQAVVAEWRGPLTEAEFREYFPGYGYTEPGFKYRKGREIDREYKGQTWQSEEQSVTTTWNVELTVTLDVLNILKGWLSGGIIKNLVVKEQTTTSMGGGEPMIVFKVTFQLVKAIVTKTNRKFEVNKIWFELLRAKSSGYSTGL